MSFEDILDKPVDEIKAPPPMPAGTYIAQVVGMPVQGKSNNENQTDFYEFSFKLISAGPDVDQEKLAEQGGVNGKIMKLKFYITEDSAFRFKEFLLDHLGISGVASIKQAIPESLGRTCSVVVINKPSKDGSRMSSWIDRTAKA